MERREADERRRQQAEKYRRRLETLDENERDNIPVCLLVPPERKQANQSERKKRERDWVTSLEQQQRQAERWEVLRQRELQRVIEHQQRRQEEDIDQTLESIHQQIDPWLQNVKNELVRRYRAHISEQLQNNATSPESIRRAWAQIKRELDSYPPPEPLALQSEENLWHYI